jgi:hypothetical protein
MQLKLRRDGDEISVEVLPKELPRQN